MMGMTTESTICIIGYALLSTVIVSTVGDSHAAAILLQFAGAFVVGGYCGVMDHLGKPTS